MDERFANNNQYSSAGVTPGAAPAAFSAPAQTQPANQIYTYNSGVTGNRQWAIDNKEEYVRQYRLAQQAGVNQDDFFKQLANGTRWTSQPANQPRINQYNSGVRGTRQMALDDMDSYRQQYQLAKQLGYNDKDFIEAWTGGTRWRLGGNTLMDAAQNGQGKTVAESVRSFFADNALGDSIANRRLQKLTEKYGDKTFDDNFIGQFRANYGAGQLSQEYGLAWSDYMDNPTAENRAYVDQLQALYQNFLRNNAAALDNEGTVAKWLSKDIAAYIPQFLNQTKASLPYMVPGAIAAGVAGSAAGPGGTVAGVIKGAAPGIIIGSGLYSYDIIRGMAFANLLEAGADEVQAKGAANDEALVSSIIEMEDQALDFMLFIGNKIPGVKALSKASKEELAKVTIPKLIKAVSKYAANVGQEYGEEYLQEILSMANARRVQKGKADSGVRGLVEEAIALAGEMRSGKADEERSQAREAGRGGAVIGAVMGPVHAGTNALFNAIGVVGENNINRQMDDIVENHNEATFRDMPDEEVRRLAQTAQVYNRNDAFQVISNELTRRANNKVSETARVGNEVDAMFEDTEQPQTARQAPVSNVPKSASVDSNITAAAPSPGAQNQVQTPVPASVETTVSQPAQAETMQQPAPAEAQAPTTQPATTPDMAVTQASATGTSPLSLEGLTSERLQAMSDEQIDQLKDMALTQNNEQAMQLLDAEYKRRHPVAKTGNVMYDATRQAPAANTKGASTNDSGSRIEESDTGSNGEAVSERGDDGNVLSGGHGRDAGRVLDAEERPTDNSRSQEAQGDRDGEVQEERAGTAPDRESVSEERSRNSIKDKRTLAAGRHFGIQSVLRNVKGAQQGVKNASRMRAFIAETLGKVFHSKSFAKRLIAERTNDLGFLTDQEILFGRVLSAAKLSREQKLAFYQARMSQTLLDEFITDRIDATEIADILGISTDDAKAYLKDAKNTILEAMAKEGILDSEYNIKGNPFARKAVSKTFKSGSKQTVSDVGGGEKVGESRVTRYTQKYEAQAGDKEVPVDRENAKGKIYKRGDTYLVVNKNGYVIASTTNYDTAQAAVNKSSATYGAARIRLHDTSMVQVTHIDNENAGQLVIDEDVAFAQKNMMTRQQSQASDLLDVKYQVDNDVYGTTDWFELDLGAKWGDDYDDVVMNTDTIRQLIVGSRATDVEGGHRGIKAKNGKTYVFFGMTANGAKDGRAIMVESSQYNKLRRASLSGLDSIPEFNIAKYLTASTSIFSPSNNDTGVKVKDCLILSDVYNLLKDITRDYMRLDDHADAEQLKQIYTRRNKKSLMDSGMTEAEALAEIDKQVAETIKKTKVGYMMELTSDILMNVTDGTGFINSPKGQSFQFRGLGGFKGQLVGMDFATFLNDNVPFGTERYWYDEEGNWTGGIRFADKEKGVELRDRWGNFRPVKDYKAFLFDSTVKFAKAFETAEAFYEAAGNGDIRSIPRENVYGAHPDSGMFEGKQTRGLAQFLRGQYNFRPEEVDAIMAENLNDVVRNIMNDTRAQARLFGVDLDSVLPPSSGDNIAFAIWRNGEAFLNSRAGRSAVKNKLKTIVKQYQSGRMAMDKGKSSFTWIDPDVLGLFNAMTALSVQSRNDVTTITETGGLGYNGYTGLQNGEVLNMKIAPGQTAIGRFPSTKGNDVQVRTNIRNAIYDEIVEKYGLDPENLYVSVNDTLSKYLDNDYDGDPVVSFQGALEEVIEKIRSRGNNKYVEFFHGKAPSETVSSSAILACVKRYLGVQSGTDEVRLRNVGIFDDMIERLNSIPGPYFETAAKKEGMTAREFKSLLEARLGVAYVLSIDYAKTGMEFNEFFKIVNDTNQMIYQIAQDNGLILPPETKVNKRGKAYASKPELIPATFAFGKAGKRSKLWKANPKNRVRGNNLQAELAFHKDLPDVYSRGPRADESFDSWLSRLLDAFDGAPDDNIFLSEAMTLDPIFYRSLSQDTMDAINDLYLDILGADQSSFLKSGEKYISDDEEMRRKREAVYNRIQKPLGLNNRQFGDLMIYSLGKAGYTANMILNFDQHVVDPSNNSPSTRSIIGRNFRLLYDFERTSQSIQQLDKAIKKLSGAVKESDARITQLMKDRVTGVSIGEKAAFDRMASTVQQVQSEIRRLETRLGKLRDEKRSSLDTEEMSFIQGEIAEIQNRLSYLKNRDTTADFTADVQRSIENCIEPIEQALRAENREMNSLSQAIETLYQEYERQINQHTEDSEALTELGGDMRTGLEDFSDEEIRNRLYGSGTAEAEEAEEGTSPESPSAPDNPPPEQPAGNESSEPDEPAEPSQPKPEQKTAETAEAESAEEHTEPENKFGDKQESVERAAKRIQNYGTRFAERASPTMNDNTLEISRKLNAFARSVRDAMQGKTSAKELYFAYESLRGTQYYDSENSGLTQMFASIGEYDTGSEEFNDAVDKALNGFVARAKRVETNNRLLQTLSNQAVNKNVPKTFLGKIVNHLNSWQINAPTFFKALTGFKQGSKGYELSDRITSSVNEEMRLNVEALNILDNVRQMKGYKDLFNGKLRFKATLDDTTGQSVNISAMEAINLQRMLDTLRASAGTLGKLPGFYLSDGTQVFLSSEIDSDRGSKAWYINDLKEALDKYFFDGEGPEIAIEYYKAASRVFKLFKPGATDVATYVQGYTPTMYDTDRYSPVTWGSGPKDFENFNYVEAVQKTLPKYMKERTGKNIGWLYVAPMDQVLNAYIGKMADYVAYGKLRADLSMMVNDADLRADDVSTLGEIAGESLGKDYSRFINNYVKDMITTQPREDTILSKLRNQMQRGVLIGNPSVMMKQTSSLWSAASVLSIDSLAKARLTMLAKRNAGKGKSAALDYRRMTGKFDPTVSEIFTANDNGFFDRLASKSKIVNFFKNGINIIDHATINALYVAACYDIEKTGLKKGTSEFDAAVDELFTRAVISTQPMFQTALRSENARTKNEGIRMLSMFRTQQTQNFNNLLTAVGEYRSNKTAESRKTLARTIKGQTMAAASLAILSGVADILLHRLKKYKDDEGETDSGKIAERFALNSAEALAGTYWFGGELSKFLIDTLSGGKTSEFYSVSFGALSTVSDTLSAVEAFSSKPTVANAKKVVTYASQLGGVPLNNLYNWLNSVVMYHIDATGENPDQYDDVIRYLEEANSKATRLVLAYSKGESGKVNALYSALRRAKGDDTKTVLRTAIGNGVKSDTLDAGEARNLLIQYGEMEPDDAEKRAYLYQFRDEFPDIEVDTSSSVPYKYYTTVKSSGISAAAWNEYYEHFNALSSTKDANGNTTVSKQSKVTSYINGLSISKAQKDVLWAAFGYSTTTAAYRNRPWR